MSTLRLAHLAAAPGSKTVGHVPIRILDQSFELPAFLINGSEPGPTLVVTAGIHGGEYPCVEAAARLGRSIEPDGLRGRLLIIPSCNPIAFRARSIYVTPPDGKNLNRCFPGDPGGTFTERWADWLLTNVIKQADAYIDMHGGDMIEALVDFTAINLTGNEAIDSVSRRMAEAYGIVHVVQREAAGLQGMTHAAAAHAGIPALLTEAGGQGVWDERSVAVLEIGVRRVMAELDMSAPVPGTVDTIIVHAGWSWLRSEVDALYYPTVAIGERVEAGQSLGRIADIFGHTLQTLTAPEGGVILFLVTSLAINKGDPLLAIAH